MLTGKGRKRAALILAELAAKDDRIAELKDVIAVNLGAMKELEFNYAQRIDKLEALLRRGRQVRVGIRGDSMTVRQSDYHAFQRDIDAALGRQP